MLQAFKGIVSSSLRKKAVDIKFYFIFYKEGFMVLIFGGAYQGKVDFAKKNFEINDEDGRTVNIYRINYK